MDGQLLSDFALPKILCLERACLIVGTSIIYLPQRTLRCCCDKTQS